MSRLVGVRLVAAALVVALTGAGCAAKWAYKKGQQAAERREWDLAVARYTKALESDPDNIGYKIALENARIQASRFHYDEAKKHLAANELEKAADELEIASNYDPGNRSAADDLQIVRDRIEKQKAEQEQREGYEQMRERVRATRVPVPVLSPRDQVPISLRFQDASLQKIFDTLARLGGVNILFDEGFRDKKTSVNLVGVTFEEALDRLTFVNRLFYKVLDSNTIIIVPESRQKRVAYNELVLRTFYLQNAEVNDTVNLIKTIAKITTAAPNPSLRAITVLGTVDQIAMAERIIEANDKARGEVIVEVQILGVDRNNLKQWGIDLSNYNLATTFSPTGAEGEVDSGVTNVRAHLLSSINRADWVVSLPSTLFAKFLQTESTVRVLASPRLRAAEGKKAELKIGQEVPIPITTFTAATAGVGTFAPATSFQYKNVGVNLSVTPEVSASGDITLEMAAEFSILGDDRPIGELSVPTFLTRNVSNTLRLRDGETGLIGGLLLGTEATSFSGVIGLKDIPIIGKIFGDHSKRVDNQEIIISLTPRIVRAPKVTEEDLVPLPVGTQEVPKVKGASPGLFGPAPEGVSAPSARSGAPQPEADDLATGAEPPVAAPDATPELPPGASPDSGADATAAPAAARPMSALFSPPEIAVATGGRSSVAVVLVGAQDLQWIELSLAWDASLVKLTEAAAGTLLTLDGTPVAAARSIESGRARVRFTRTAPASGSGAVASLTFEGLAAGTTSLVVESVAVGRAGGSERPAPPPPARIVVTP